MARAALLATLTALIAPNVVLGAGATSVVAGPTPAPQSPIVRIRVLAAADLQPVLPLLVAAFTAHLRDVAPHDGSRDHDDGGDAGRGARSPSIAEGRSPVRTPEHENNTGVATDGDVAFGRNALASQGMTRDHAAGGAENVPDSVMIEPIYGSSGKLATQISSGLDADLFLAADDSFVNRLATSGHVDSQTRTPYARGRVALWVPQPLVAAGVTSTWPVDPAARAASATATETAVGMAAGLTPSLTATAATASAAPEPTPTRLTDVLRDPRVTRLVIANPVHAPYGRAAVAILADAGLIHRIRPGQWFEMTGGIERFFDITPLAAGKHDFVFVIAENAAAAAQMALSSPSIGLLPLSLALTDAMQHGGRHVAVSATSHPPLNQTAIALTGRASPAVRAFLAFLISRDAQVILRRAGFDPPRP